MKKLLCVLMFGMVFGQAELTTRVYEINNLHVINGEYNYLDVPNLLGFNPDFAEIRMIVVSNASIISDVIEEELVFIKMKLNKQYYTNYFFARYENDIKLFENGEYKIWGETIKYYANNNIDNLYFELYIGESINCNLKLAITTEFPEEDSGYIEEGFDYCIDVGANLVASPCRDALLILDTLPSEIANNLTGIIGQGVAANNQNGNWMGSLNGLGGGNGYWFQSNVSACFNYNCAEN